MRLGFPHLIYRNIIMHMVVIKMEVYEKEGGSMCRSLPDIDIVVAFDFLTVYPDSNSKPNITQHN